MTTNRLVNSLAIVFAMALTGPAAVTGQVRDITLNDAISLALQHHPSVVQARGDVRVASASRREAIGNWLPSVTGSSGWSTNSTERFDQATQRTVSGDASTSYSASLNASMTIFDGFRRSAQNRTANANVESAEASLTSQRFQITLQTKQAFFNALAAEELVRVAESQIRRGEEQLKVSTERLAAGSAIRSDTLRAFVELGNSRLQLLNAQTQRATAVANLARLIGYDGSLRAVADSSIMTLNTLDTAALREEALANAPAIEQAAAEGRAADAQVTSSRGQYFPRITASYQNSFAGSALDALSNNWSARVSLSWPLFNGFTRETAVSQSLASQDAARARMEDTGRQVNADMTQQFAALEAALLRFNIAAASRAAAEEDLRVQQERYRLGAATIVEVLTSQVSLDQAEVDIVQARLDFLVAKAQLEALVGREI
jgi:outer membrane protein TolC